MNEETTRADASAGAEREVTRARRRAARRLALSYLVTAFFLVTLNFFLPRAMPGDPVSTLLATGATASEADVQSRAELARYYGLDQPIVVQYGRYLSGLARGDLGLSLRYRAPVADLVRERLPWSLLLVGTAVALATAVGALAGVHSGWRRGKPVDRTMLTVFMAVRNLPVFFLASLALFVFAVKLGWFPLSGASTPFSASYGPLRRVLDVAHHLVLPASVLAVQFTAGQYLVMRGGMVAQLGADHLLLGRAKGLAERRLKYRYAARNALLPAVTLTAALASFAVSGSVLVETVFAYQGMGRLLFESVGFRDYPTLQACFLVLTLVVLAVNFLADVLYTRLDPRTAT